MRRERFPPRFGSSLRTRAEVRAGVLAPPAPEFPQSFSFVWSHLIPLPSWPAGLQFSIPMAAMTILATGPLDVWLPPALVLILGPPVTKPCALHAEEGLSWQPPQTYSSHPVSSSYFNLLYRRQCYQIFPHLFMHLLCSMTAECSLSLFCVSASTWDKSWPPGMANDPWLQVTSPWVSGLDAGMASRKLLTLIGSGFNSRQTAL